MIILVADTSVLIDLDRGNLLEHALRTGDGLAVPDFLFRRELEFDGLGDRCLRLGMRVLALEGHEMTAAQAVQYAVPALSLTDCTAYVCALRPDHLLLTGDGALRRLAIENRVDCHGLLWLLDRLEAAGTEPVVLHAGLSMISAHQRCRLPLQQVQARLRRWR